MRFPIVVAASLLGFAASSASTQTPTPTPRSATAVERNLFRLEDEWTRALVRRDAAAFDRLLAPRFVYTENDQVMTRAQLIDALTRGADTVDSAANEDMKAYVYGNTAVVTGWLVVRGRGQDGAFNRRYRYTDTWVNRGGRWQVMAAQDYLAP
jgi:ketosteroid isomerase-like protein